MTGINRVLALAAAAALVAPAAAVDVVRDFGRAAQDFAGGDQYGQPSVNPPRPKYPGYGKRMGVKQAQRRAAKRRRNVLRSKGHFRKAVR